MGHVNAFHHGGRWEPQFNLGWFTPPLMPSCLRIGIGFNLSQVGRDPNSVAEQEQVLRYFERFRRTIEKSWQGELARWMGSNGGFIQYGGSPACARHAARSRGRMGLDRAEIRPPSDGSFSVVGCFSTSRTMPRFLSDRAKLASAIDDTFRSLYPVWLTTYTDSVTG